MLCNQGVSALVSAVIIYKYSDYTIILNNILVYYLINLILIFIFCFL
jgi:hypothetical protein